MPLSREIRLFVQNAEAEAPLLIDALAALGKSAGMIKFVPAVDDPCMSLAPSVNRLPLCRIGVKNAVQI